MNVYDAWTFRSQLTLDDGAQSNDVVQITGSQDSQQLIILANATQANNKPLIELRNSSNGILTAITSDSFENTFVGASAGVSNTPTVGVLGLRHTYVGYAAGQFGTTGYYNTALGNSALNLNTAGYQNVAIGYNAVRGGSAGISPFNIIGVGYDACRDVTTAQSCVGVGTFAMRYNQTGRFNMCVGVEAGMGSSGNSHNRNVFIGHSAGRNVRIGDSNVGIGGSCHTYITDGGANVAIGHEAGLGTSGFSPDGCTYLGFHAGRTATGDYNTCIGYNTGDALTTGSRNILIGESVDPSSGTVNDELNIGNLITGSIAATKSISFDTDSIRVVNSQSPASNGTGTAGEIAWDGSYLYVCTATDTWARVAITGGY